MRQKYYSVYQAFLNANGKFIEYGSQAKLPQYTGMYLFVVIDRYLYGKVMFFK